ncbi:MAG: Tellurite resistance protein TehB [Polyangiaceae bacterium]|nr:Tellurite resistance protein TehB [Polyangiaceae bacterium]
MRATFREQLQAGFDSSPYARFVLAYRPSESRPFALDCTLSVVAPSLGEQYEDFLESTGTSEPFGAQPDAMVLQVARDQAHSGPISILDVGAGNGRNSLPLARLGAVDALEPVSTLAAALARAAEAEALPVRVLTQGILDERLEGLRDNYDLVVMSEVTPHFSRRDLNVVLPRVAGLLSPGGSLLFNAFVARSNSRPEPLAEEAAQSVWSTFFSREELTAIASSCGLSLHQDASCVDYERQHSEPGLWPPTAWYVNWANGRNLFGDTSSEPSIELRWLEYRRG